VIIGAKYTYVQQLIESSMSEGSRLVQHIRGVGENTPQYKTYDLYAQAWPAEVGGSHLPSETAPAEDAAPAQHHFTGSAAFHEKGHHFVHTWVLWAFAVGIGLGVAIYLNGYAVANALMKIPPLRWIHNWLYRRMYFDELYATVLVGPVMWVARFGAWLDRKFVDGLVNWAAHAVKRSSDVAGLHDRYVIDGAVNGMATATRSLGSAVRAPQSGRIRMYVTVLLAAVVIGIAAAVIVIAK
jgi:NADH:ubiquinone oxidoreductase subunit 5 (subunit L)/multisubunit Na+/H+ antiporter MnhA subunit